ncbi:MAG: CBS domain-containing protein [Hyphomicrobiales bacterium]|nr:CBS domain-containing protein [Hyphomicrobiales bacterium]
MRVSDVMKRKFVSITSSATAREAACHMRDHGVGCLPVTEEDRLVGLVTDRDIVVRCVSEGLEPEYTAISQIMSVESVCCYDDQQQEDALDLMHQHGLMRLPVLNRSGKLVGLVSQRDFQGDLSTKTPYKVSFYKDITASSGQHRLVPVHVVYVTGTLDKEQAEKAAQAKLQKDMHVARWSDIADGFTVDDMAH